jgi:hypothetical protein
MVVLFKFIIYNYENKRKSLPINTKYGNKKDVSAFVLSGDEAA